MKAEKQLLSAFVFGVGVLLMALGAEVGKTIYSDGYLAGLKVCEVRAERMVRDVDSLTILVRNLELEILGE